MGTAAAIALLQRDGSVRTIYLSGDGGPTCAGKTLLQAWNSRKRVESLLELGDLLWLGTELGEAHDRENRSSARAHSWCTAYTRDHGSCYQRPDDRQAQTFPNLVMGLLQSARDDTPWTYVYEPGGWVVYPVLRYPGIPLTVETIRELVAPAV
jgi:hypothetical protein